MKDLFVLQRKMIKSGLTFRANGPLAISIVLCLITFFLNNKNNFGIFIFSIFVYIMAFALGFSIIEGEKYKIYLFLPVKIKEVVKTVYLYEYMNFGILILLNLAMYIFKRQEFCLINILFFSIFLLMTNLVMPKLYKQEFKVNEEASILIIVFFVITFTLASAVCFIYYLNINFIDERLIMILSAVLIIFSVITLKASYKKNIRKTLGIHW